MSNIVTPYLIDIDEEFEELLNTIVMVAGFTKKMQKRKQLRNEVKLRNKAKKEIVSMQNNINDSVKEIKTAYEELSKVYPSNKTFREIATGRFTSHRIVLENINKIKYDTSKNLIRTAPYNNLKRLNSEQLTEAELLVNEYALRFKSLEGVRDKINNSEVLLQMRINEQRKYIKLEQKLESELKTVERDLKRMRSAAALRIIKMIEKEANY